MIANQVDVVGLGQNATDAVFVVRRFPALGGKERVISVSRQAGGQIASALVTCQRLSLKTRYLGKVGDDDAGRFQLESLREEGVDVQTVGVVSGAPTQFGHIIVDQATGERTVFWDRDSRLAMTAGEMNAESILSARALHMDGCDVGACLAAARLARSASIPVVADLDTVYSGVETLFPCIDYLLAPAHFFRACDGEVAWFRALENWAKKYKMKACGATLGRDGSLVFVEGRYIYSPGFAVQSVDTTGAGDVFHGAFIYGLLSGWPIERILEFSNAMAALNCTVHGARGGIGSEAEAVALIETGARRVNRECASAAGAK